MTNATTTDEEEPTFVRIPAPDTVSPQAQAFINAPVNLELVRTVPKGIDAWHTSKAEANGAMMMMVAGMKEGMPVSVDNGTLADVPVRYVTPTELSDSRKNKIVLNAHGGGYVYFDGECCLLEALPLAWQTGYKVVTPDFRTPPDHPFPAAIEDVFATYKELLKSYSPEDIAFYGASSGGALCLGALLMAQEEGVPMPAALGLSTPWAELGKSGGSYLANEGLDPIGYTYDGGLAAAASLYAGDADIKNPLISPVHANYSEGFPPSLIITGTRDLFLSNSVRLHRKLRGSGLDSDLHVFEAMWHSFFGVPETEAAMAEVTRFFDKNFQL